MDTLDETIRTLRQQQLTRGRLQATLARTQALLSDNRERVRRRRERLRKEEADVERLEGKTLTALLHWALSDKESKLRTEREEAVRARVHYEEARDTGSALTSKIEEMERRLEGIGDVSSTLVAAHNEKEAALSRAGGAAAERLFAIAEERATKLALVNQIDEAEEEGDRAEEALEYVIKHLEGASSWGAWDMLGGGLITTAMKHSEIDKSRTYARTAQDQLQRFSSELGDVLEGEPLELEIGGFLGFADYFMDGFFVDAMVQTKIGEAKELAVDACDDVRHALEDLERRRNEVVSQIDALENERKTLLGSQGMV